MLKSTPRVIVAVVVLALTLGMSSLVFSWSPKRESYPYSMAEGVGGDPSVRVWGKFETTDLGTFPDKLSFTVTDVSLSPVLAEGGTSVCIAALKLELASKTIPTMFTSFQWREFTVEQSQPCVNLTYTSEPLWNSYKSVEINWKTDIDTDLRDYAYYVYPFDKWAVQGRIITSIQVKDDADQIVAQREVISSQTLGVRIPGWEANEAITRIPDAEEISPDGSGLLFERPLLIRVLIPAFLLMLLFIIIAIPFVESLNSKIEIAVAVIIGLVGTRQVLVPTDSPSFVAVDALFLIEMFAVALSVAFHPISKLQWGKRKDNTQLMTDAAQKITQTESPRLSASKPAVKKMRLDTLLIVLGVGAVIAVLDRLSRSQRNLKG